MVKRITKKDIFIDGEWSVQNTNNYIWSMVLTDMNDKNKNV